MRRWGSIRYISSFRNSLTSTECRARIAEHNPRVNAFVYTSESPSPLTSTELVLPLAGKPIAVKDSICTKDMPTTCSSNMLRSFDPPYDATVVQLLRAAGADIIGKTNCDEFGMGSLNTHSIHGPVVNPYVPSPKSQLVSDESERSAGGSSGGSAAAVAAGMCYAALGTDTGGSTRLPASYCGVVGLKPSYGLLSRWGVVSFADSLDCVGVMAATVSDTQRVFDILNVYDSKDPTTSSSTARSDVAETCKRRLDSLDLDPAKSLRGLRIGVPQEYFPSEMTSAILRRMRHTMSALQEMGATVIPVHMPATGYALSAYYVLASAEASSCLARFDGVEYGLSVRAPPETAVKGTAGVYAHSRSNGFGREVKKRILLGTYALSADAFDNYFLQAQRVRQLVKNDFNRVFSIPDYYYGGDEGGHESEGVDVLIHPSAIQTAPKLKKTEVEDGVEMYMQDVLTVPASLAGVPGLSVPVPSVNREDEDGWPVGVSVIGQWGCEEMVFKVGMAIEGLGMR